MARKPSDYPFPTAGAERIKLTPALIEGFVEVFLRHRFDLPQVTPAFHRELWEGFCSDNPLVSYAAPRGFAKSTAITFSAVLANMLFGQDDFALIIGSIEEEAARHLAEIANECYENKDLIDAFKVNVLVSNETELVVRCGGREFCIIAKAPGQKIHGIKWRQKRPSLIVCDDVEGDMIDSTPEMRRKLRQWYLESLLPCGSDNMRVRDVGTIPHLDSLKERQLNDPAWLSKRFRAHAGFDDFSELLWPEKFSEERLRSARQRFINQADASGYSTQYLSWPIVESEALFLRGDFLPMEGQDYLSPKTFYIGIDGATTKNTRSDPWAFVIGGMDSEGIVHIVDVVSKRMDTVEAVDMMFKLYLDYSPETFIVASDMIQQAIGPFLFQEMRKRKIFFSVDYKTVKTHQDKIRNSQAFRARMRAHGVRFDTAAPWFIPYQTELISFPKGQHDDLVDASANIGLYLNKMIESDTEEEISEEEWANEMMNSVTDTGRSAITGY